MNVSYFIDKITSGNEICSTIDVLENLQIIEFVI
jgi:hypothetical protein